ncbi:MULTISPECIES: DUF4129 domain-containing protein [unclassified Leifsonia]|uniref:DUF4129 domain-containing protein n=1 Tax=unclassified Leifsonia TaxID=2663824 RepID=UPI0006FF567D|nr:MULTISPECIES: DUF4129 domain-containing protein [unclassified Leifsonia]KQX06438.1 hypothetical protein ASC59_00720 [Leifsonia sp. Root1293]KRA10721.1 hypothetical protein ASD61_00720 [Leifsonia sp. Root60]
MSPGLQPAIEVPVDPSADEARRLLLDELAKPEYQAARPTWFDQLSQAVRDWFLSLFSGGGDGVGAVLPAILVVLVVAALVSALVIYGLPRLNRRAQRDIGVLFGDDDARTADAIRRSSAAAAADSDFATAIVERFRAIARTASDRAAVSVHPGTTADDFARRAARAFPGAEARLNSAARVFDGVRYLGQGGSSAEYALLVDLDDEIRALRPAPVQDPVGAAAPR